MNRAFVILLCFCCVALLCSCGNVRQHKTISASHTDSTALHVYQSTQQTAVQQENKSLAETAVTKKEEVASNDIVHAEFNADSNYTDEIIITKKDEGYIITSGKRPVKSVTVTLSKSHKSDSAAHHILDTGKIIAIQQQQTQLQLDSTSIVADEYDSDYEKQKSNFIKNAVLLLSFVVLAILTFKHFEKE